MVCRWGMSEKLGPLAFGKREGEVFLGPRLREPRPTTPRTPRGRSTPRSAASSMGCYERAKKLLTENRETLERIAEALLEYETLDAEDVNILVQGGTITRERPSPA